VKPGRVASVKYMSRAQNSRTKRHKNTSQNCKIHRQGALSVMAARCPQLHSAVTLLFRVPATNVVQAETQ
jgi:hypothetical protein